MNEGSRFMSKSCELVDMLQKNREMEGDEANLFLLDVGYDGEENKALMKFYDPDERKIKWLHDRTGHRPYCLTDLDPNTVRERVQSNFSMDFQEVTRHDLLEDTEKTMTKVLVPSPREVGGRGGIRGDIGEENAYEAWIPYHLNYIYDRTLWPSLFYDIRGKEPILSEIEDTKEELIDLVSAEEKELSKKYLPAFSMKIPKIEFIAMDIEVQGEGKRIAQPKDAENPVMAVSFVKSRGKGRSGTNQVFLLEKEGDNLEGIQHLQETEEGFVKGEIKAKEKDLNVRIYQNERELLLDTFRQITETPLLLTFNGDAFDLYYLYERAKRLGISKDHIPFSITVKGRLVEASMKVGIHIDLYAFFRNAAIKTYVFKERYQNVSLNEIAKALLGKEKTHKGVERFEEMDELPLRELAVYNFYDSYLTAELFRYNDWISLKILVALSRITRYPMRELSRRGVSSWIENWIKAEHRDKNFLIPNAARMDEKVTWAENELRGRGPVPEAISRDKKFRGGMVLEPKKGTWFDVFVLDFASLYPSVIKVHNISYETVLCPHEECRNNTIEGLPYWICTKRQGIFSKLVGLIRDVRVEYFKPRSKGTSKDELTLPEVMQGALKVLINASYGVLGAEHFPFYQLFTAETVTAIGRSKIKRITDQAKELGLEVLYGDTDSIFIHHPKGTDIERLIEWSAEELKVDLEIDKVYRFLALSSRKKNYFGILESGETDIKGMMVIKRNTPPFLKREFERVTKILKKVNSKHLGEIKGELAEKITDIIQKIDNREYSLDKLAFHTQLTKPISEYTKTTPQHVQAAKELKQRGEPIQPGQIISYVKTKGGVEPLKFADPKYVNWEKYLEFAETAFDQLLDAFGLSFEKIKREAKGIKGLDEFLG